MLPPLIGVRDKEEQRDKCHVWQLVSFGLKSLYDTNYSLSPPTSHVKNLRSRHLFLVSWIKQRPGSLEYKLPPLKEKEYTPLFKKKGPELPNLKDELAYIKDLLSALKWKPID